MPSNDDFLFSLQPFTHTDGHSQAHQQPEASGSNTPSAASHYNGPVTRSSAANDNTTTSILAGLNAAFTPEDGGQTYDQAANDFAEQLALWTNANFSFDAPTGHALLLDDEKEEEARRNEREREDAANANGGDGDRRKDKGRQVSPRPGVPQPQGPQEPTHRDHKQQADQSQQSNYFAPPSLAAGEGRRPGYGPNRDDINARRHAENAAPNGTSPMQTPNGEANGNGVTQGAIENAFSAFSFANGGGSSAHHQPQQPFLPAGFAAPGAVTPEVLQAIAFQQYLASMTTGAAAPYTAAVANPFSAAVGPLQGFAQPMALQTAMANGGFSNDHTPTGFPGAIPWNTSYGQDGHNDNTAQSSQTGGSSQSPEADDEEASSSTKRRKSSQANGRKKESSSAAQDREDKAEIARALRDEIPPLQLIDTGNPEADAEANRLAIEEDKRRRNTAASARFRVKKKQREQALEAAAKELENRVKILEEENGRLVTENGWLKSLIHVRPGSNNNGTGATAGMVNPAAANLLFQNATAATFPGSGMQPTRHTGLQPRGVGTPGSESMVNGNSSNAKVTTNGSGKRSRED